MEPKSPAPLELRILQALWKAAVPTTVQELSDQWIPADQTPGYTTLLKKLQVMEEKSFVAHHKDGKAHRYYPLLDKETVENGKFQELSDLVYQGDRLSLVLGFMKHTGITPEEIAQARRLLDELEGGKSC